MNVEPAQAAPRPGRAVAAVLDEYGRAAKLRLHHYLGDRRTGHVAYLFDLMGDYPSRGGRSLRPALCLAATRAFGGRAEDALDTAVSIELFHNAFLIHDDVEDASQQRRGRPTLHAMQGIPLAVNVGDAMTALAFRPLIENCRRVPTQTALWILTEAEKMAQDAVEGQALELGWRRDNALDLDECDYLRMVLKKTCSYTTIFPLRAGAILAGRRAAEVDALDRFAFFLGAAFQIQDDVLNLAGDAVAYGKEIGGDIREGKRTLMLIHLLGCADRRDRAWLHRFLGRADMDACRPDDVSRVRRMMDAHGSIEYARRFAHACAGAALHEFSRAFADVTPGRERGFVEELCTWVISRD